MSMFGVIATQVRLRRYDGLLIQSPKLYIGACACLGYWISRFRSSCINI